MSNLAVTTKNLYNEKGIIRCGSSISISVL